MFNRLIAKVAAISSRRLIPPFILIALWVLITMLTNWVQAAGSSVSSTNITIDGTQPTLFYRLIYP